MYLLCVSMRFASVIPRSRRISPRRSVIPANVKRDFRATIIARQLRFPPNIHVANESVAFAIFHEREYTRERDLFKTTCIEGAKSRDYLGKI